jgi:hypothetical protein
MTRGWDGRNLRSMNFSPLSISLARRAAAALSLIVIAAFLVVTDQAFAAKTGTLSVNVAGVPKKSKKASRTITVRAIDVRTGALVQASESKRTNVSLKLAPGAYMVAVRSIDFPGTAAEGTSGIAVIKSGKKTKKKLRAKPLRKTKKKKSPKKASISASIPASYFAPASETAGMTIAGIDPAIRIKGFDEYPNGLEIDSVLATQLTKGCPADTPKLRFVEVRRRAEIVEEIDRGDDPRFDKSTTVKKGRLWKERQMVRGAGIAEKGRVTVQLSFVDLATGEVLSSSIAEGAERDFFDVIDAAANSLLEKICGAKVDVTFTGSGSYRRDEGSAAGDSEDHVTANFSWSTTYRGVSLSDSGSLSFATVSSVQGTWNTDGRYGAVGPGNYSCSAPIKGYSGEFSMMNLLRTGGNARLTIDPYLNIQGDFQTKTCSGLPGPPFASFSSMGRTPANQAVIDFAVADVSAGPLTFNVAPTTSLAPDCSDMVGGYESPCTQSSTWSGTVTVSRAQP